MIRYASGKRPGVDLLRRTTIILGATRLLFKAGKEVGASGAQ